MNEIGIGVIGTGFMGRAHALAWAAAPRIFGLPLLPRLEMVADNRPEAAARAAREQRFRRHTGDWRALVADPAVGIVSITTPNVVHEEMALAALALGKPVHCEKPIAPDAAAARRMMEAAEAAGVPTQVGYNYIKNPLLELARDMIAAGEIGEVTGFRGLHAEDYMASPATPHSWRTDPAGGGGAIADLGSHIIGLARFLLGPVAEVSALLETVVRERPVAPGAAERRPVLVDDVARLLVRFASGVTGTIEANWVATGRKMQLGFEVHGSGGALAFTQERMNELLLHRAGGDARAPGFLRIEAGPQHGAYGRFCPAPGHQLGFNDLKTIEMAEFLAAVAGGERRGPDFREAWEIQRVIDAAILSHRSRSWVRIG